MKTLTLNKDDYGVVIQCTLVFTDFDAAGATAVLKVASHPDRVMSLSGNIASYTVRANDFKTGFHVAEVQVLKPGISLVSEGFILRVDP